MCVSFWSLSNTPTQTILSCQWVQTPLDHPLSDFVIFEHSLILALDKQNYSANISSSKLYFDIRQQFMAENSRLFSVNNIRKISWTIQFPVFSCLLSTFPVLQNYFRIFQTTTSSTHNKLFVRLFFYQQNLHFHFSYYNGQFLVSGNQEKIHNFLDHLSYLPPY